MNARPVARRAGGQRGFTLLELLIASVIFVLISLAVGAVYISAVRGIEQASTQGFVQRQGTRIQEVLADHLSSAVALYGGSCGPVGTSASFIFQKTVTSRLHPCTFCCLYEFQDTALGDVSPQLYLCSITSLTTTTCASGTAANLLAGTPEGRNLRVSGTAFTQVFQIGSSASIVVSPAVNIRFELRDTTFSNPTGVCRDQTPCWQFQLTATVRN
jgi:prepilin-type N-terminal cleavage/methylation domain-containing protein